MSEELNLVKDLAVILIAAGVFTLLSKALKQPLILGYIIAGFVVGPHLGLFHLTSQETVEQWSEIGIIFLLFALGLEFSFKKLLKVGSGAMIMAGIKCIGMFIVGIILAQLMNWSLMEGIFLGGLLSMSSTTIIIKAYGDMGLKNKPYAPLIFGSLVVEDLIAVLLMVLLSTLATTGRFEGMKMAMALGKLVFFLVLWFLIGIYLIPTILEKVRKILNDETLLIVAIGLCFGMVIIAESVGFSSALGAFVMGSILAETLEGERIEHLLGNIKDLFGAIFFVSVGMMVDPGVIASQWLPILLITVVAMAGIMFFSSTGALLAGAGFDTAVHSGFTLAQLGEFAFIIAALGCSLGVMRDFIYPVVIAVSVITTFTTPYMIKAADPAVKWLNKVLPKSFLDKVNSTSNDDFKSQTSEEKDVWKSYLGQVFLRIGIYTILLLAIFMGGDLFLGKFLEGRFGAWSPETRKLLSVVITIAVMIPFLYGLTLRNSSIRKGQSDLVKMRHSNMWTIMSIDILRILIAVAFILAVITEHYSLSWVVILLIVIALASFAFVIQNTLSNRFTMEDRFFENLGANEEREKKLSPITTSVRENLDKYNVHIESVTLSPDSQFVGQELRHLPFRKHVQVNIVKISRGSQSIVIPSGDTPVYPYDTLLAVGTEQQLNDFREIMKGEVTDINPGYKGEGALEDEEFVIRPILVDDVSFMNGKTLRELSLRGLGCMVICYLRDGELVTNPSPDEPLMKDDLVWLAGLKSSLGKLG